MRLRHQLLILILLAFVLLVNVAYSQTWERSMNPILHAHEDVAGVVRYSQGLLWAGYDELWVSSDLGITWQLRAGQSAIRGKANRTVFISAIEMVSPQYGYISTCGALNAAIMKTSDSGSTWQICTTSPCQGLAITPDGSVLVGGAPDGTLIISRDSAQTWNTVIPSNQSFFTDVHYRNGIFTAMEGFTNPAVMQISYDSGKSWTQSATLDGDTWSFCLDSCNAGTIWASNEDLAAQNDHRSEVFKTTNGGSSWTPSTNIPRLAGAIVRGDHILTASVAYDSLLLRSTDDGDTWNILQGPHLARDSRLLATVGDSLIIAVDSAGYIWRGVFATTNTRSLSPSSLFTSDTLRDCDTTTTGTIYISEGECPAGLVANVSVIGKDSLNYPILYKPAAGSKAADSVIIQFKPDTNGPSNATLQVVLSSGKVLTAALGGDREIGYEPGHLSIASLFSADTLGQCDTSVTEIAYYVPASCSRIRGVSFLAGDSADYELLHMPAIGSTMPDSIVIRYVRSAPGQSHASVQIESDGGQVATVELFGYREPNATIAATTQDQIATSIGGIITVPFYFKSSARLSRIRTSFTYDPTVLHFEGALVDGVSAPSIQPTGDSTGIIEMDVPSGSNTLSLELQFSCFPSQGDTEQYAVTMLPGNWESSVGCEQILATPESAFVTVPADCESPIISHFMLTGAVPSFTLQPNPADGELRVAVRNAKDYSLTITDLRGRQIKSVHATTANTVMNIRELPSGTYILTMSSAGWSQSAKFEKR